MLYVYMMVSFICMTMMNCCGIGHDQKTLDPKEPQSTIAQSSPILPKKERTQKPSLCSRIRRQRQQ